MEKHIKMIAGRTVAEFNDKVAAMERDYDIYDIEPYGEIKFIEGNFVMIFVLKRK